MFRTGNLTTRDYSGDYSGDFLTAIFIVGCLGGLL